MSRVVLKENENLDDALRRFSVRYPAMEPSPKLVRESTTLSLVLRESLRSKLLVKREEEENKKCRKHFFFYIFEPSCFEFVIINLRLVSYYKYN